jgi:benzylsuccinate CoA-transferase BbsF subunit
LCAAVAVLSAIESRRRTGVGQHIDIAQLETGTYLIGPAVLDFLTNGREAHPIGNADPFGQWCPNEVYRCGDQHEVAITCRDDDDWKRLCDVVSWDIADLAGDVGLATAAGRCARAGEIDARLRQWCTSRTADAAAAALQGNGVPAGKVQDGGDLTADPQLVARDFWGSFDHAVFGPRPFDRFPGLWSTTDLQPYVPSGAYIGEANFDVYRDIAGMSEDDIGVAIGDGLFN